jgi:hypothetical protein
MRVLPIASLVALWLPAMAGAETSPVYFAPDPGAARVAVGASVFSVSNATLGLSWTSVNGRVRGQRFENRLSHRDLPAQPAPFVIVLSDGRVLAADTLRASGPPRAVDLPVHGDASRLSDRVPGKAVVVEFEDEPSTLHVTWRVVLRDGSNYVRQEVELRAGARDVPVREVRLVDWSLRGAHVVGTVRGSPVVAGTVFVGFEDPLSSSGVASGRARAWIERELPLRAGQTVAYSAVVGVTAAGQVRRGFLRYVERERAHPYRTFLHYNSWYDLGYFSQYDEADTLRVVNAFGTELTRRRGVTIDSFLFDDGWDDPATLWQFGAGFPDGFTKVAAAAAAFGAAPGVWLSPWGGYGTPKQERVEAGQRAGYEIVGGGFALSGPKYYEAFHAACVRFLRQYGVNQFKFDGTGNADRVVPGSRFDSDFAAAIQLIRDLRALRPDLYVNLTTGTYPSPFWLRDADSIWRGGEDHAFLGVGSKRERWITYRDADVYEHVVMRGPLFPLNSLMLHGLIYARFARGLDSDPQHDFDNEVHDYFGTGTQLQEMYITPALLTPADWDTLAEAAAWSRANADVLVDTHWIGGDPADLDVYGWASWSPRQGILVLRNPSDHPQAVGIDVGEAFELPRSAARAFELRSPWKRDASRPAIHLDAGRPHVFQLAPFEVLVLATSGSASPSPP